MKHLFYLVGIFFIWYEMNWILNPFKQVQKSKRAKEISKQIKGLKYDQWNEEQKDTILYRSIPSLFLVLWLFIGLFSFNWIAFASILVFNMIVIAPLSKIKPYGTFYTCVHWVNSLIGFVFGVFVILNSYHLKINIYELVMSLF